MSDMGGPVTNASAAPEVASVDQVAPPEVSGESSGWRRREVVATLVAGAVLHFMVRVWISLPRTGPVVIADEIGYLLNARFISGGAAGDLATTTFYRGGYSLLIAPLFLLDMGPVRLYISILALNAAVAAAIFPLMYVLLGKLFTLSTRARLAAAFASACTPSLMVSGGFATSDAVLPTLVVALVALLLHVCTRPPLVRASVPALVMFAAVAALAWTTHARGQLVVMAVVVVVLGRRFFGVGSRMRLHLTITVALTGVLVLAGTSLNRDLASTLYSRSGSDLPPVSEILDADALVTIGAGSGQIWSLLVTTGGLAMVGLVVLWLRGRDLLGSHSLGAAMTLAILGIVGASALGFGDVTAESYSIYSRYVDMFAPLLVGIGCAGVAARHVGWKLWCGVALAIPVLALGPAVLDPLRSDMGDSRPFSVPIVAVMSGVAPSADGLLVDTSLLLPTICAVVFVCVVGILTLKNPGSWRSLVFAPLAGTAMLIGGVAYVVVGYTLDDAFYPNGTSIASYPEVRDATVVVWDAAPASNSTLRFVFEYSTGRELVQFDSSRAEPPRGDVLITSAQYEPPEGWILVGPVPETGTMLVYRWSG